MLQVNQLLDNEIIDLTCQVFSTIVDDLNNGLYKDINGEISVRWSIREVFYAWAAVDITDESTPKHYVGLTYETVVLLYRDVEAYFKYIESGIDNDKFDTIFQDFEYPKSLSLASSLEDCKKNMFISGITWLFFHELGHLVQEHGIVRQEYGCGVRMDIVDCASNDNVTNQLLTGKASAVSHVTEIAADYFATISCLRALARHFDGSVFDEEVRSFSVALALVLYRFHGTESFTPMSKPKGSHPIPLIRLEQTQPLIFEVYSKLNVQETLNSSLSRLDMINITSWSSYTVGLFWLRKNRHFEIPEDYFIAGSMQRHEMLPYHKHILEVWDEIKPRIDEVKRIDDEYSELQFSPHYRNILENIVLGSGN